LNLLLVAFSEACLGINNHYQPDTSLLAVR
jgi:hypothetical protein